ncbi:hypothetical protein ADIARSV_0951 [Arcticibacter svalbardensis MN12-7]|uniref:Uncharacterized protein n=1 Tax=Arcticibacter svalbardensis MN12-7 TaxID=1150600 RepID=R9GVH9_9SPHI|nr:hypothetical protein ADIARSV_0951 [Arcticibacter svalbardensis MN12-7]
MQVLCSGGAVIAVSLPGNARKDRLGNVESASLRRCSTGT